MILPWAHRLISAGAHGLRRIPGQSVNLAHLIWRTPRAPAPLPSGNKVHPRWFSTRGYGCWGHQPKRCHPGRRKPIRDLQTQSPRGSPLCATASAGMTDWGQPAPARSPLPRLTSRLLGQPGGHPFGCQFFCPRKDGVQMWVLGHIADGDGA
jgi:hypothetical protein